MTATSDKAARLARVDAEINAYVRRKAQGAIPADYWGGGFNPKEFWAAGAGTRVYPTVTKPPVTPAAAPAKPLPRDTNGRILTFLDTEAGAAALVSWRLDRDRRNPLQLLPSGQKSMWDDDWVPKDTKPLEASGETIDHQERALLLLAEHAPSLDEWTCSFLRSVSCWEGELTSRQQDTLSKIIEKGVKQ